jgi:hypothetical protein
VFGKVHHTISPKGRIKSNFAIKVILAHIIIMTGVNSRADDLIIDTDIFVVIENEEDLYDFVTIDETALFDAVVIDMSQDDFANAIMVDFETDFDSENFVSIDEEDQIFVSDFFVSDFTEDDILTD